MALAGNLDVIAAAVERLSAVAATAASYDHSAASNASKSKSRPKLVLPSLTSAMEQDFILSKGPGANPTKPLSITLRPEFADYPLVGIVEPHTHDVLCGRGGGSNNHPGNESFRDLVNEVKVPYVNCPKREKPLIARRVVEAVRNQTPPGRFLSKGSDGLWHDIGDTRAREKTSQALREGAPVIRVMADRSASPMIVAAAIKEAKKSDRSVKEVVEMTFPEKTSEKLHANPTPANAQSNNEQEVSTAVSPPKVVVGSNRPTLLINGNNFGGQDISTSLWNLSRMGGRNNITSLPFPRNNTAQLMEGFSAPPQGLPHNNTAQLMEGFSSPPQGHPRNNTAQLMEELSASPQGLPHNNTAKLMEGFSAPLQGRPHNNMEGFSAPPQGLIDNPFGVQQQRYPEYVSIGTVRRLLLGQLDPVQLACHILKPEDAALVARRHAGSTSLLAHPSVTLNSTGILPTSVTSTPPFPLMVNPQVSDSSLSAESSMQRTQSDVSSVDSSKPSGISGRHSLPKKKRKYVGSMDM